MTHFKPAEMVRALGGFMDLIGVKSAGGRIMLGVEVVLGLFLLMALGLLLSHDLVEFLVNAYRGEPRVSSSGRHFQLFVAVMVLSLLLVFVREMILPSKDRSS